MAGLDPSNEVAAVEALIRRGMCAEAESICRTMLQTNPDNAAAWGLLAVIALSSKQYAEAEAASQMAVKLNPRDANSWHHLSTALFEQRRPAEAEECSRYALALNADNAAFWLQLGNTLFAQQQFVEASEAYLRATSLDPLNPRVWNSLGSAEHVRERSSEAQAAYERSLALDATQIETRLKLAFLMEKQWCLSQAEKLLEQIIADAPLNADAWTMLGRVRVLLGDHPAAVVALKHALSLRPSYFTHSRLLQALQYGDDVSSTSLLVAHGEWNRAYASGIQPIAAKTKRIHDVGRRLRIGFVSADFGRNPVGYLALPLLEHLDKSQCSVACYFDCPKEDEMTSRFRAAADLWRVTFASPSEQIVEQIVHDEIDVLVDLMGHVGDRLMVFAHKPAPIQMTWLGYVGTTGIRAIDYLLADRFHVRPGEEAGYVEAVLRMPNGYACYGPPEYAPDVNPLPALSNDHVSFGCFNNPAKYSRTTFDLWCAVLHRVQNAQILLKYFGLHEQERQHEIRSQFANRGIDARRILIEGGATHQDLLAAYHRVDIVLDTQPYSGGLTTCEALWMGVPVITYPGSTFASRHSTSHMINAGFPQFVARNAQEYVELAVNWARRIDELAMLRSTMREQVRQSALCDAPRFAQDFLNVLAHAT